MNVIPRIGFVAVLLAACASGPTSRTVYLLGEEALNANGEGKYTPVNVRVFQLTDRARFEEADFDSLWRNDPEVLGDSLVETVGAVVTTAPEQVEVPLVSGPSVRFVGIVALFNREGGLWRRCVAVDEVEDWLFRFREYQILQEER